MNKIYRTTILALSGVILSFGVCAASFASSAIPGLCSVKAGNGQVTLGWTAASGAVSYSVQYGTKSGVYTNTQPVGNTTGATVTGLSNGTKYCFIVTATNAAGTSKNSAVKSAVPLAPPLPPTISSAKIGNASVALSWTAAATATSYTIEYGTASGVYDKTLFAGNVKSHTITRLTNNIIYYLVVTSSNASGPGARSAEVSAMPLTIPAVPGIISAVPGSSQVELTWSPVAGAKMYSVLYGTRSGVYGKRLVFGNVTNAVVTGLTNGTVYYFVVTATNIMGTSKNSIAAAATPFALPPPASTTISSASAGDAQVVLSWTPVAGATGYFVKYGTASGRYNTSIDAGNQTSYTLAGLNNGTPYYFVVTAVNTAGTSPASNEKIVTPKAPMLVPPVISSATNGNSQSTLTWGPVTGAIGYSVKYRTATGSFCEPIHVDNSVTGYTVTGLTNGVTYYFVVTATSASGVSSDSSEKSAIPNGPKAYVKHVEYNVTGQPTLVQYGNGVSTTYSYDPRSLRLKRIYTINAQSIVLQDLSYTYDALGQVLSISDNANTASQSFAYDEQNRLTQAQGSYGTKKYVYDNIGNLKSKDGLDYTYGELNGRIDGSQAGPHAVTSLSDGSAFTYDLNGNMVSVSTPNKTTSYQYDVQNRLTAVRSQGTGQASFLVSEYKYDGDGGRTKKIVYHRDKAAYCLTVDAMLFNMYGFNLPATDANTTVETTRYVGNLYEDNGSRQTKYIYMGGTRIAGADNQGNVFYFHADHLGSTNILTDRWGGQREVTEYDPFGQIVRHDQGGVPKMLTWNYYTGKALDDESGLMYYGARYYNQKLGRFITPDTIVQAPSNPQTLNRYSYCGNNPVNMVDPTGHKFKWGNIFKAVAIAVVGVVLTIVTAGAAAALFGAASFWTAVAVGAVSGAAIGGTVSAAMGGNIGQGMLTGAISGAIFGGIGSMQLSGWAQVGAHTLGGAASGGINAAVTGDNIGQGALIGGISAGVSSGASNFVPGFSNGNYFHDVGTRAALGGLIGGGVAASQGGQFMAGFRQGAMMSAIAETANGFHQTLIDIGVGVQRWLSCVGEEMEKDPTTNIQDALGVLGYTTGWGSNAGLIPRGIGESNEAFFTGGRVAYQWANQHGSGIYGYSLARVGLASAALNVASAAMTGWTVGAAINAYAWGTYDYFTRYGGQ